MVSFNLIVRFCPSFSKCLEQRFFITFLTSSSEKLGTNMALGETCASLLNYYGSIVAG